jgi:hypothetical protein
MPTKRPVSGAPVRSFVEGRTDEIEGDGVDASVRSWLLLVKK